MPELRGLERIRFPRTSFRKCSVSDSRNSLIKFLKQVEVWLGRVELQNAHPGGGAASLKPRLQ